MSSDTIHHAPVADKGSQTTPKSSNRSKALKDKSTPKKAMAMHFSIDQERENDPDADSNTNERATEEPEDIPEKNNNEADTQQDEKHIYESTDAVTVMESETDVSVGNTTESNPSKTDKFRKEFAKISNELYNALRHQCERIETNYQDAERENLRRDDVAFLLNRHETEISNLVAFQASEVKHSVEIFERSVHARQQRKESKRKHRATMRETKKRDKMIQTLESASNATQVMRKSVEERNKAFDKLVKHMDETHERQCKQIAASQDRKLVYDKRMNDLEIKHLPDEVKTNMNKQFQVRQSHQVVLNKRVNDQLAEIQETEMRHAKERFDVEVGSYEETSNIQINNKLRVAELETSQMTELQQEKEKLVAKAENEKLDALKAQHQIELKRLQHGHRVAIRQLKIQQEQRVSARKHQKAGGKSVSSAGPIQIGSNMGSKRISRQNSTGSVNEDNFSDIGSRISGSVSSRKDLGLNSAVAFGRNGTASGLGENMFSEHDEVSTADSNQSRNRILDSISIVRNRHREEMNNLNALLSQELNDAIMADEARMSELEEDQQLELDKMRMDHAEEIRVMVEAQEKEIAMEQSVHEAEMHMMIERRVLNSVLDNVVDGIINITPKGIVTRFNAAAEKMFGYAANEVIGENIKMLMPEKYAVDHDQYLMNYMTTGVKKVIGTGRRVYAMRKGGIEFPVHLAVSEVKENDQHLFTGIVRDLTEDVRVEEEMRARDDTKKQELQKFIDQLAVIRKKSDDLLSQMLPPSVSEQLLNGQQVVPQSFDSATVFFLDVVGFTTMCAKMQPMEAIDLLNAIYQTFDEVIEQYDAYKVETIGDSYMIVSGVPKKNGSRHAAEIATLALHILSKVHLFRYEKYPDMRLRVRIGLNTGPVVAGVVGTKMPRYCLFGDTVNTASRMESTGQPMKIQISETTHKLLVEAGGYRVTPRGETEVKGKGKMTTYFLTGKQDFPFELPPQ